MLRLAWFPLRAVFWLGVVSLFVPGSLLRETITGGHVDLRTERRAQDTLTPADRVASWRKPPPLGGRARSFAGARVLDQ